MIHVTTLLMVFAHPSRFVGSFLTFAFSGIWHELIYFQVRGCWDDALNI